MDPRPDRNLDRSTDTVDVRISDPGGVAAALPALLGFRPCESLVLVGLTGSGGRVRLTVRGDLPSEGDEAVAAGVLTRGVLSGRPGAVLLAVVSEAPDPSGAGPGGGASPGLPHRRLVHEVVRAHARAGVPVLAALLVRAGRWWSYDCSRPCCAPGAGTALPAGVPALQVASVATGMVVERDRGDLVRRITGPDGPARAELAATCASVAVECAARILDVGSDLVAEESWSAVTAAVARCRPGAAQRRLSDRELARVVWALRDRDVRDRALELATGADAPAAENLWTECTRRAPAPLDAAPATLLAVSAWLRGDGAMANIALGRALATEPGYALARLLARALAACVGPAQLRAMIEAASSRPGARGAG